MGTRGPVPKRSEDRIRRNLDDPVEKVVALGTVTVPPLLVPNPHPMVRQFYDALADSAQSRFYEPSDWAHAQLICHFLQEQVNAERSSGQMMAVLAGMMADLLVTEGDRRRVKMEIEREQAEAKVLSFADEFEKRFSAKPGI